MKNIHNIPPTPVINDEIDFLNSLDFTIIDVETTGVDSSIDKITEIAAVRYCRGQIQEPITTLIDPEILIPPTACAVNHITNKTVEGYPRIEDVSEVFAEYIGSSMCVAHNSFFDRAFVNPVILNSEASPLPTYHQAKYEGMAPDRGRQWVCTMRLAKHLLPEAPSFSNEALRYWLDLTPSAPEGSGTHRAAYDIMVTLEIFKKLASFAYSLGHVRSEKDLFDLSLRSVKTSTLKWGAHIDKNLEDVPTDYLEWAIGVKGQKSMSLDEGTCFEEEVKRRKTQKNLYSNSVVSTNESTESPAEATKKEYIVPFGSVDQKGKNIKELPVEGLKKISKWITDKDVKNFFDLRDAIEAEIVSRGEIPANQMNQGSDAPLIRIPRRFGASTK